jgi:nucleoid-associated protein Lsr2
MRGAVTDTTGNARGTVASKTVVELFDDLDGGRADETVKFALDGVEYEIDLSTANAASLRDTLAVYIGHAHRPARRPRRAAEETVATVAASTTASSTPTGNHARNGRNGKVSDSASMTAEIRRLASESAQKVSQAARAAAARADDEDALQLAALAEPARPTTGQTTTVGPVPALVIPFMEAGR